MLARSIVPDEVIVPPFRPVPAVMLVTDPLPLLLNVVQSALSKKPSVEPLACGKLIAGVVPPDDTIGAVPLTDVTVPEPAPAATK